MSSLDDRVREMREARVPYVHARVVLAEAPTSAKPGAEAIVLADGTIEGFVGGNCAESTVRARVTRLPGPMVPRPAHLDRPSAPRGPRAEPLLRRVARGRCGRR